MTYTVLWTPEAENDLATIWIESEDRKAVATAANAIDTLLREQPQSQGESRYDSVRVMFAAPLGIDFEVVEEDRAIYVLTVWSFLRK